VIAIQNGAPIFTFSASFQAPEAGLDHQSELPDVPPPEALAEWRGPEEGGLASLPEKMRDFLVTQRPFELRPVEAALGLRSREARRPVQHIWFRAVDRLADDDRIHQCLLAYVSDFNLLGTALLPHGVAQGSRRLIMASIDHAMWFHRAFRFDDWLLYAMDSPSASGARGFARGSIYTRDGRLVASTAQEGLIRVTAPA
jgi:acyl-CoA thioesterase-2